MQSYSMISHSIIDGKIFITIDKVYNLKDQNGELESINVSVSSLPIIGFKEEDASKLPWLQEIKMIPDSVLFNGFLYDEELAALMGGDNGKDVFQLKSTCYELPTDPLLALHTIILLDDYVLKTKCQYKGFNFKKNINNENCNVPLEDLFDGSSSADFGNGDEDYFKVKHVFYDKMISIMKDLNNYQPVIGKLKDFYNICKLTDTSLLECINNPKLSKLIWTNNNPYDLVNDLDPVKQSEIINAITDCTLNTTNKWGIVAQNAISLLDLDPTDWNKIIQDIFRQKLINLCAPCDGQKAYEGSIFSMKLLGHTEVKFIVNCAVNLTLKDGRICLTDLKKNAKYKSTYAVGKELYKDFENELVVLGKYIGLEFEVFNHHEIILTQDSHDLLERKGFIRLMELANYFKKSPEPLVIVNKDYKEPEKQPLAIVSNVKGTLFAENSVVEENVNQDQLMEDADEDQVMEDAEQPDAATKRFKKS
jgi:hypothetical protein